VAILIDADGTEKEVHPRNVKRGFTLEELYLLIGCATVQAIEIGEEGSQIWMDEDGKYRSEPTLNKRATALLHNAGGALDDFVVGTVLLTMPGEVK
jgi:hypothetical protein